MPVNSNLAKVYFLQDFISFYVDNEDYYSAIFEKEWEKTKKAKDAARKKQWDKYL